MAHRRIRSYVPAKSAGIDVSDFQSGNIRGLVQGSKFFVVKTSEGTWYHNPKAKSQFSSGMANGAMPMAYHFANFGANAGAAKKEADYAARSAKALGLPRGSVLACDWETGDGNNVYGGRNSSAKAILSFMNETKKKGYKPMFYSGASIMRNNVNTAAITHKYPNSLWVASYPTMKPQYGPNFNYFPSMPGVAIWQYSSDYKGRNVDGNVNVLPLRRGAGTVPHAQKSRHKAMHKTRSKGRGRHYRKAHCKVKRAKGKAKHVSRRKHAVKKKRPMRHIRVRNVHSRKAKRVSLNRKKHTVRKPLRKLPKADLSHIRRRMRAKELEM